MKHVLWITWAIAACGPANQVSVRQAPVEVPSAQVAPAEEPAVPDCTFGGGRWSVPLRVEGTSVLTWGMAAGATLFGETLQVHVAEHGWHFLGSADLTEEVVLRVQQTMWLGPGVFVRGGHLVKAHGVGLGTVEVTLPVAFNEQLEWVQTESARLASARPRRRVGCAEVGLSSSGRAAEFPTAPLDTEATANEAPPTTEERYSTVGREALALALQPGGTPFVRRRPSEDDAPWTVKVLEEQGEHVRVQHSVSAEGSSVYLVGWLPRSALLAEPDNRYGIGGLGAMERESFDHYRCRSTERLALTAHIEGRSLPVGYLDPDITVQAMSRVDRPEVQVLPVQSGAFAFAPGLTLTVQPTEPLQCVFLQGNSDRFEYELAVDRAEGLACSGADCQCRLVLTRRRGRNSCRAELRCGMQGLFGYASTNGFFTCDADTVGIRGEDTEPTRPDSSGDPRFSVDTAARTVTASDEAQGPLGAFTFEARIVR